MVIWWHNLALMRPTRKAKTLARARVSTTIVASCHQLAKWRRRELNENAVLLNEFAGNHLEQQAYASAVIQQCFKNIDCLRLPSTDAPEVLLSAWPVLPPHIREAILTLVDAGLNLKRGG